MKRKILTVNERRSDNIGDQAIAEAMEAALRKFSSNVDCLDFSFREDEMVRYGEKVKSRRFPLFKKVVRFFKIVNKANEVMKKKYDDVVVGGGQLVLSNKSFPLCFFIWVFFAKLYRSRVSVISVGVGDSFPIFDRCLYSLSLRMADSLHFRDLSSVLNAKKNFGVSADLIPDVVYSIASYESAFLQRKVILISPVEHSVHLRYAKEIGVREMSCSEYVEYWTSLVREYSKCEECEVVLCGTTKGDSRFAKEIKCSVSFTGNNSVNYLEVGCWQDFLSVAKRSEKVISGRMHALILAHLSGAQVIPYIVSNKIASYEAEYIRLAPEVLKSRFEKEIGLIMK